MICQQYFPITAAQCTVRAIFEEERKALQGSIYKESQVFFPPFFFSFRREARANVLCAVYGIRQMSHSQTRIRVSARANEQLTATDESGRFVCLK